MDSAGTQLRRTLSPWQLTLYGVGSIVGAGIYSVLGEAAREAGPGLWISLMLAGATALLAALSYAELASMFPGVGAEYRYLRSAFPRRRPVAVMAGWLIAVNAMATCATVALAFGHYLRVFADLPAAWVALALLLACSAVNIAGIRESTWVSIGLILVEVGGLLLIGIGGLVAGRSEQPLFAAPDAGLGGPLAAAALLFFMFIGFEDVANLSEEAREPRRYVPRALLIAVVVTTALYLLVALGATAAVGDALGDSESPLEAAGRALDPRIGTAVAIAALFATASTALITLVSISRLLYGMARQQDLPAIVGKLLPGRQTPWVAGLVLLAGACALLPLGSIKITASVSALGLLCVFAAIHVTVIVLRWRAPQQQRAFRIPGALGGVPVTPVAGLALSLLFMTQIEPKAYAVFAAAVGVGLVAYAVHRSVAPRPRPAARRRRSRSKKK